MRVSILLSICAISSSPSLKLLLPKPPKQASDKLKHPRLSVVHWTKSRNSRKCQDRKKEQGRNVHTIVDVVHNAGAELDRQGLAGAQHGVTHGDTRCLLVHLDGGGVALETNNLAHKVVVTDTHLVGENAWRGQNTQEISLGYVVPVDF